MLNNIANQAQNNLAQMYGNYDNSWLRRWCLEQATKAANGPTQVLDLAQQMYDWVTDTQRCSKCGK